MMKYGKQNFHINSQLDKMAAKEDRLRATGQLPVLDMTANYYNAVAPDPYSVNSVNITNAFGSTGTFTRGQPYHPSGFAVSSHPASQYHADQQSPSASYMHEAPVTRNEFDLMQRNFGAQMLQHLQNNSSNNKTHFKTNNVSNNIPEYIAFNISFHSTNSSTLYCANNHADNKTHNAAFCTSNNSTIFNAN